MKLLQRKEKVKLYHVRGVRENLLSNELEEINNSTLPLKTKSKLLLYLDKANGDGDIVARLEEELNSIKSLNRKKSLFFIPSIEYQNKLHHILHGDKPEDH